MEMTKSIFMDYQHHYTYKRYRSTWNPGPFQSPNLTSKVNDSSRRDKHALLILPRNWIFIVDVLLSLAETEKILHMPSLAGT